MLACCMRRRTDDRLTGHADIKEMCSKMLTAPAGDD